ncbi:MAG: hypothetical protein K2M98_03355, partial [Muribaculum sp.]|nr:hypothetical protein [Muribaculum sp.]
MKTIRFFQTLIVAAIVAMTTSCGASDKALNVMIDEINSQLETQSIPGIEKMYMSADDNYVIYNYVVDENAVDFDAMKQGDAEARDTIIRHNLRLVAH